MVKNATGKLGEEDPLDFPSDGLLENIAGEKMVQGPDGLWYSKYSISDSGLRLGANKDDLIEGKVTSIEQLNALLESNADKGYLGVTIPDISALIRWERSHSRPFLEDIALENALQASLALRLKESLNWVEEEIPVSGEQTVEQDEGEEGLDEEFVLQEIQKKYSTLPPQQKAIRVVEKVCRYRFAWWESEHPLVRLWGQLDSDVQVIGDSTLILDLVQILGRDALRTDEGKDGKSGGFNFVSLIGNAQTLKKSILEKFAEHKDLLDAIISRQQ